MIKLLFRSCVASDGRKFAFLTDQPEVEECFDNGYKVAYKDRDGSNNPELLAHWKTEFTVTSPEFTLLPESEEIPAEVMTGFKNMISGLLKGIDVLFCDYNLGIEGDLPMCNEIMDIHKSTDFVLFSCADIVGDDPSVQPYMVSYAAPRYDSGKKVALQHRIYCKTDPFAFCQAINAIVVQRKKDNLMGGHIRTDITPYITEQTVDESVAKQAVNHFVDMIRRLNGDIKTLPAPE
ncbi:hypothetical protein [Pseudoalteromonas denitrificans]|uniref:Uncharacterized protein n=1 Tax=Pseudoalteromonas denitrificans DSM 6059 TaxID=1123010 RepID=A0A1I1T0P8_9GAMM|nr:hypothetical protein [Pseudoalteromonas denitrificans]SFD48870.1 hypothetical protein SAMN02745724_04659 [Pseudoalteromonas denitrificans DSM 6059]